VLSKVARSWRQDERRGLGWGRDEGEVVGLVTWLEIRMRW